MELIDVAHAHPGCCLACQTSQGPFVDTKSYDALEQRRIFCLNCVGEMTAAAGGCTQHERAAMDEALELQQNEINHCHAHIGELHEVIAEVEKMRQAIAYTMERGWVVDPKKLTVRPRPMPGTGAIDWLHPIEVPSSGPTEDGPESTPEVHPDQATIDEALAEATA